MYLKNREAYNKMTTRYDNMTPEEKLAKYEKNRLKENKDRQAWRELHPEVHIERMKEYYQKNQDKMKTRATNYYAANRVAVIEKVKARYRLNKEKARIAKEATSAVAEIV